MTKIFILSMLMLLVSGCASYVMYDDFGDTVRYKPETEYDYINYLQADNPNVATNENK